MAERAPLVGAQVFEQGALYDPMVLDIKEDDLMGAVGIAITRIDGRLAAAAELSHARVHPPLARQRLQERARGLRRDRLRLPAG